MRIVDAHDMYEDADANEDGYKHRMRAKAYRRSRTERREAALKVKERERVDA